MFEQKPTPLQEISSAAFSERGIRLFVKRDDLLHSHISGNKWRKLKYNLFKARELGNARLLTFGGAYSNHLAATAAAGQAFGFPTMGIVRGEKVLPLNPTLKYAEQCGMELKFVSRTNFRAKNHEALFEELKVDPDLFYVLPEGGSNCLALTGVAELVSETEKQLGYVPDFIVTACGTGATLAGLVAGLKGKGRALGIPVLKGNFMHDEVAGLLNDCQVNPWANWETTDGFHFGGYAKFKPELVHFINDFKSSFGIPLDPIYTGKAAYALFELASKGYFHKESTVVFLHTGGLQGIAGFHERHGHILT